MTTPNEKTIERIPPSSQNAEQSLLGAMLISAEAVGRAIEILRYEYTFYYAAHRKIFRAITDLYAKSIPADITTVAEELERTKDLTDCGGRVYLANLAETTATGANAEYYAQIVLEKYKLRATLDIAAAVCNECFRQEKDASDVIGLAQTRLFEILGHGNAQDFVHIAQLFPDIIQAIEARHEAGGNGLIGISTGLIDLDEMTGGWINGELILIAGASSMGKSALAMNFAETAAKDTGKAVAVYSLEMTAERLANRMLCGEARINSRDADRGRVSSDDWVRLAESAGRLNDLEIYIDSSSALKPIDIRSKTLRLASRRDVGMVIIDYIQIMQANHPAENRTQTVSEISGQLKALAKELDVPVLALSQLSRANEVRGGDRRPQLSDLRDSGALGQDADVVMFVYRPAYYLRHLAIDNPQRMEVEGTAEIIVEKQRNGPTGTVYLGFKNEYCRFSNLTKVQGPAKQAGMPF